MPFINGIFIMDLSYYTDTPLYIPPYNNSSNNNYVPPDHIHPNSAAAELGLTPEELAPILREQQRKCWYEYVYAQPPWSALAVHDDIGAQSAPPPFIHPESATTQLRLTPEEAREVHEECIHAQREIQEEMDREDRATREWTTEQDTHNTHPPPFKHDTHNTMNDHDTYAMLIEQCGESSSAIVNARPNYDNVEPLAHELVVLGSTGGDWAEASEEDNGLTTQGEYTQDNYSPGPSPAL
jgi:hypothetical protein